MGNSATTLCTKKQEIGLPIELRGVSLQVVKEILNEFQLEHIFIAMSKLGRVPSPGETIVHGMVKEMVYGESYAEYVHRRNPSLIGRCNVFLSHTWGSPFEDTVAALEEYEAELPISAEPRYYFIDYFAVNQFYPHKDLKALGNIASGCETLALFAKPYGKPEALGRAWCIFELAHAVLGKANLVLIMPPYEKIDFRRELTENLNSAVEFLKFLRIFTNINSRNMEASIPKDLEEIKVFVKENLGGFDKVDQAVVSGLRCWVGETALGYCDAFSPRGTLSHAEFLETTADMLTFIGMYEQACMCAQKSKKIYEKFNSKNGIRNSMTCEALALGRWQKFTESLELLKELYNMSVESDGISHDNTVMCRYNLGYCYMKMKLWDIAEFEITAVLESSWKLEGLNSRDIRGAMGMLGEVLRDSGKDINRAEELFKQLYDYGCVHGPASQGTLVYLSNYARCLAMKGDDGKALESYKKAFPDLLKAHGPNEVVVQNLRMWIIEAEQKMSAKKL